MDGIQLLGAPSMNWKPPRSLAAQNHGTSGSETRNPSMPKMLPTQRMASLFSFGNSRRTIAPTSGVNKIMERMWLCIFSSQLVERAFWVRDASHSKIVRASLQARLRADCMYGRANLQVRVHGTFIKVQGL